MQIAGRELIECLRMLNALLVDTARCKHCFKAVYKIKKETNGSSVWADSLEEYVTSVLPVAR